MQLKATHTTCATNRFLNKSMHAKFSQSVPTSLNVLVDKNVVITVTTQDTHIRIVVMTVTPKWLGVVDQWSMNRFLFWILYLLRCDSCGTQNWPFGALLQQSHARNFVSQSRNGVSHLEEAHLWNFQAVLTPPCMHAYLAWSFSDNLQDNNVVVCIFLTFWKSFIDSLYQVVSFPVALKPIIDSFCLR